jgi:hypothetical protein
MARRLSLCWGKPRLAALTRRTGHQLCTTGPSGWPCDKDQNSHQVLLSGGVGRFEGCKGGVESKTQHVLEMP